MQKYRREKKALQAPIATRENLNVMDVSRQLRNTKTSRTIQFKKKSDLEEEIADLRVHNSELLKDIQELEDLIDDLECRLEDKDNIVQVDGESKPRQYPYKTRKVIYSSLAQSYVLWFLDFNTLLMFNNDTKNIFQV